MTCTGTNTHHTNHRYVRLKELWGGLHPLGVDRGTFVLLRGYIDESYNTDVFVWSCIIAQGNRWTGLEAAWKRCIASQNKRLAMLGRPLISRYHASDCSSRKGEYRGWDTEEQIAFVKQLFAILKNYSTYTVVWDVKISDVVMAFPDAKKEPLRACYSILTKFMLDVLGRDIGKSRITLFHDRSDYDATILQAFNKMVKDPKFAYRKSFIAINSYSWEDCIALQPADLVAFEVLKRASGYKRKSFEVLLDLGSFGIRSKSLPLDVLQKMKADLVKDGKIQDDPK